MISPSIQHFFESLAGSNFAVHYDLRVSPEDAEALRHKRMENREDVRCLWRLRKSTGNARVLSDPNRSCSNLNVNFAIVLRKPRGQTLKLTPNKRTPPLYMSCCFTRIISSTTEVSQRTLTRLERASGANDNSQFASLESRENM